MQSCTLCSPGQQGYVVDFDSQQSLEQARTFLAERKLGFAEIDACTMWIGSPGLKDCMECSALFSPVTTWEFRKSVHLGAQRFETDEVRLSWSEVRGQLPGVFIDTLIDRDAIRMMRQPIVDVSRQGRIVAYELLARGYDADGGLIAPAVLFGEARAQNRLFALDKHCRIAGVKAAAEFAENVSVFINFIPTAIYRPEHCLRTTMAAAGQAGVDLSQLVFEVVETDFVEDTAHLKTIFDFYRKNGVRCALDDVGAGFNDIEMLKSLSPDVIKLDRSIADGVASSAEKQEQAAAVQAAAAQVGAVALGEGIESQADSDVLALMGYKWQQGYLFGKPGYSKSVGSVEIVDQKMAA